MFSEFNGFVQSQKQTAREALLPPLPLFFPRRGHQRLLVALGSEGWVRAGNWRIELENSIA
jgi:hypothetical protein